MFQEQTSRRAILIGLFVLLALGASSLLVSPRTEAVGCDGGEGSHGSVDTVWVLTQEAQARTAAGLDCPDPARAVCREECIVACGSAEPQGNFACFAN